MRWKTETNIVLQPSDWRVETGPLSIAASGDSCHHCEEYNEYLREHKKERLLQGKIIIINIIMEIRNLNLKGRRLITNAVCLNTDRCFLHFEIIHGSYRYLV